MFKRLNQALQDVSRNRVYNIILILILITMSLSFISSSPLLFVVAIGLSIVEIGIIIQYMLKGNHHENIK